MTFVTVGLCHGNETLYKDWLMPGLHRMMDAETAHKLAIRMASYRIVPHCPSLAAEDERILVTGD